MAKCCLPAPGMAALPKYQHLADLETHENIRTHYYEMKDLLWKAGVAKKHRTDTNQGSSSTS